MDNTEDVKKSNGNTEKTNKKVNSFNFFIVGHIFLFIGISINSVGKYLESMVSEAVNNIATLNNGRNFILFASIFLILLSKFKMRRDGLMFLSEKRVLSIFKLLDIISMILSIVIFVLLLIIPSVIKAAFWQPFLKWLLDNNWTIMIIAYVLAFYFLLIIMELGENFVRFLIFCLKKLNAELNKIENTAERYTLLIAVFGTIISFITLIK